MKTVLSLLGAVLLTGVLAWLLLAPEDAVEPDAYVSESGSGPGAGDAPMTAALREGLEGRRTGAPPPRKRHHNPLKPYKERVGALEIVPVDPDGESVSVNACTVHLERVHPPERLGKLGRRDLVTGAWHFDKVPIGSMLVVITGDHLVETREIVRVRESTTTYRKLPVEQGALVRYRAELPTGELPAAVALTLITSKGRPAEVYWQVRSARQGTSARRAARIRQAAEGVVFGLRPGRYKLRAQADDDFDATEEIIVAANDTLDVTLHLRR